jgi:hypothetical protein
MRLELANIHFKSKFLEQMSITNVKGDVHSIFRPDDFLNVSDLAGAVEAPEHVPAHVKAAFDEGAKTLRIGCYNAAGAMFRLCLDLATKPLILTNLDHQPSRHQQSNLAARLEWLMEQSLIPKSLADLAACVRHDGNDGVHDGSLGQEEAEDLLDFTVALLERLYTEPAKLHLAEARRMERRKGR